MNSESGKLLVNGSKDLEENGAEFDNSASSKGRSETIDLSQDNSLQVDISDALSEKDKVKFTVHTKTTLPDFQKPEMSVTREHEEFIWLHDVIEENENYAGLIIPPTPPRPDFDASREKLQKLGDGESSMTREEFNKMKAELEAEYLATFKKTVAMHEVFLCRLACHPVFRNDHNFRVFLEFESELNVRGKNKKERIGSIFRTFTKSADEVLLSGQKDVDDFFDHERKYLVEYHTHIKDSAMKAEKVARTQKNIADTIIKVASGCETWSTSEKNDELHKRLTKFAEGLEKLRKLESRVATDFDLKMSDCLRYYQRDTQAAKDLLYRRLRCLADYETANKNLERSRAKNKEVQSVISRGGVIITASIPTAEMAQQHACEKFEKISDKAKTELTDFKGRRLHAFKKNLIEMAELQLKHHKAQQQLLQQTSSGLTEMNEDNNVE